MVYEYDEGMPAYDQAVIDALEDLEPAVEVSDWTANPQFAASPVTIFSYPVLADDPQPYVHMRTWAEENALLGVYRGDLPTDQAVMLTKVRPAVTALMIRELLK